jgi:hypothetical protein
MPKVLVTTNAEQKTANAEALTTSADSSPA